MVVNKIDKPTGNSNINLGFWSLIGDIVSINYNTLTIYNTTITNSVFDLSGDLQRQIDFLPGDTYIFDQSNHSNLDNQIVFGVEPDASVTYITGKTVMGTPGKPGAYTQLVIPDDFTGPLFYYHDTIPYMGYGPLLLSVDLSSAGYGDIVTFTVTNRTGVVETYQITGVVSEDINGANLNGTIGYGQQVDLSYVITGGGSDMVFSVGDLSENVTLDALTTYDFAVQDNILGQPVFAVYNASDAEYHNQPVLSFSAPNVYQFDLSSSLIDGGYTLTFGTEVDNISTVIDPIYITRESSKIILDLRTYTGESLVYFEDSNAGIGYDHPEIVYEIVEKLYNPPINGAPTTTSSPTAASGTLSEGGVTYYQRQIGADLAVGGEGRWIGQSINDWISLDLTTSKSVLGVLIQPGWHSGWSKPSQYIQTLEIQISTDNINWTTMSNDDGTTWNSSITS